MRRAVLVRLVVGLVAAFLAAAAGATHRSTAHIGCAGKDIHFKAADGVKLVAHRWGTGKLAIVLAHEDTGNLCQWAPFARTLAARGYTALAFDFRGYGESQAPTGKAAKRLGADVTAAVKLARSFGATRVIVEGASMGGWATVVAAASTRPAVAGAISISTPADYLGNLDPFVRRLTVPLLFVAARGDVTSAADAQRMYDEAASTTKRLTLVRGSAHGLELVASSATVRNVILGFIASLRS